MTGGCEGLMSCTVMALELGMSRAVTLYDYACLLM